MTADRMPALFIGHGSPMLAVTDNVFRTAWQKWGQVLPRPEAILCISAHWQTHGTAVATALQPHMIYDFAGFPAVLYQQQYPAPGAPAVAAKIQQLFPTGTVVADSQWGLDHGAWCVLQALFPAADVPVLQLSLNRQFDSTQHYAFAAQLAVLREQGVLILGSGNIVHNLSAMRANAAPTPWAVEFDDYVRHALVANDQAALTHYTHINSASLAVPTDEHYLPLLYVQAVRHATDTLNFFAEGFDMGTLSMRSFILQTL